MENSSKDGNTRPPDLPPKKSVCRSRSNSYNWTWNDRLVPNQESPNLIPGWGRSPWDDWLPFPVFIGFPSGSDGKQSACNVGYLGLIPGLGRSPGGGHGNPLQYSCLENPHGLRSLAGYSPWGCKESDMTELLSTAHKVLDSKSHWDRNFVFTAISFY